MNQSFILELIIKNNISFYSIITLVTVKHHLLYTPIWLDNLSCTSTATTLNQCSHSGFGFHDCTHSEDFAISCESIVRLVKIKYCNVTVVKWYLIIITFINFY